MSRQCPRCGGAGTVYEPRLCTCGHTRADHIAGVGCVGFGGYCLDECQRFSADPEQNATENSASRCSERFRAHLNAITAERDRVQRGDIFEAYVLTMRRVIAHTEDALRILDEADWQYDQQRLVADTKPPCGHNVQRDDCPCRETP